MNAAINGGLSASASPQPATPLLAVTLTKHAPSTTKVSTLLMVRLLLPCQNVRRLMFVCILNYLLQQQKNVRQKDGAKYFFVPHLSVEISKHQLHPDLIFARQMHLR